MWIWFADIDAWYMPLTDTLILGEDMPWELLPEWPHPIGYDLSPNPLSML